MAARADDHNFLYIFYIYLSTIVMKKYLLLLSVFIGACVNAQSLNPEEKKILETIHTSLPQHMRLLQQMVDINSGTLNINGVRANGEILWHEFMKIGFGVDWISMPDSMKRAGHLVAYKKGKKGKKLFLIGHLDTVFEPDMPPNPYRRVNDSIVTGQGVEDMKGGDIIILAALHALYKNGLLNDATITAYFTGDEEKTGKPDSISRKDYIDRAKQHDIALAFEGAIESTIATGRRGYSDWQLKVYGVQAHSSGVFRAGYGAVYEAARIINEFRLQLGNEQYLTFNPGLIIGGTEVHHDSAAITGNVASKVNIISPLCVVQGDLRYLTTPQRDSAKAKMLRIASNNNLFKTRAELVFKDGMPPMEPTKGNADLAAFLSKVSKDLGYGTMTAGDPAGRGAGDVSYISRYVSAALDGLGAEGWGGHAPGEIMNLNTFERQVQRAAILIYRLTR
jgi:glutamate carboxypeptidase